MYPIGLSRMQLIYLRSWFWFSTTVPKAVLRIWNVYPGSEFFSIPGPRSRIQGQNDSGSRIRIPDPDPHQRIQKNVSKISEIWSGMFIPDPYLRSGSWFFYPSGILDTGVKKAPDPGSGSATLTKRNIFNPTLNTWRKKYISIYDTISVNRIGSGYENIGQHAHCPPLV